jgi:hypothetical protein
MIFAGLTSCSGNELDAGRIDKCVKASAFDLGEIDVVHVAALTTKDTGGPPSDSVQESKTAGIVMHQEGAVRLDHE